MPLPSKFDVKAFLLGLDRTRDLCGVRVVYYDGAIMTVLRQGPPISQADLLAVVIRRGGKDLVPTSAEIAQARDQRFHAELLNLGMNCGGALLAWVTTWTTAGAAPVTGGTSLIITKVAAAAGYAGTIQCVASIVRVGAQLMDPGFNINLDDSRWYPIVSNILEHRTH